MKPNRIPHFLLATLLLACAGPAQSKRDGKAAPETDPYTAGRQTTMAALGYTSFGPFDFGTHCHTNRIAELLPKEQLRWVETAHFRIGVSLPAVNLMGTKDKEQQDKLRAEMTRLAANLQGLPTNRQQLDPWLRLHLTAQRAEDVYREVQELLGVRDDDFPASPGDDPRNAVSFRGRGPFLGNPQKFTVLLVQHEESLIAYTAAFHGRGRGKAGTHHDHEFGSAWFGASLSADNGRLQNDLALRTQLAYHIAHNLYTSFRSYGHDLPTWLVNGLAHRHARNVSTRFPIYDLRSKEDPDGGQYAVWDKRWQFLLRDKRLAPLAQFVTRMDVDSFQMDDHLQSWALVDWLANHHAAGLREFMHRMKDPFFGRTRFPTHPELFERQQQAMLAAFGTDAEGLETMWRRRPLTAARL